MRAALPWLLVIVLVFATVSATEKGGTPDSRAAKAAAEEWLRRTPEFAAKIGKEPWSGSTRIKDHDHAVVVKTSWPRGTLQGVVQLRRINGAWQVTSAKIRPRPTLILAITFRFDFTADGKAEHIELFRCVNGKDHRDAFGLVRADEIARAAKIIASRQYHPTVKVRYQKAYDHVLFDQGTRNFLLD